MATKVQWGWMRTVPAGLKRAKANQDRKLGEIAEQVGDLLLENLRKHQPIGKLDPYVEKFPGWRVEARPSVRQGLIPIERGWVGPDITSERPGNRVVTISTNSEHLKYFTMWTGRTKLGTDAGVQVARNAKTLAFWWRDQGWWPKSAKGGEFTPQTDFVQDAWNETEPVLKDKVAGFARYAMQNAMGEVVE